MLCAWLTLTDPTFVARGRICPGRAMADATLFITIASILHVFDILPALDSAGNRIRPQIDLTSALNW